MFPAQRQGSAYLDPALLVYGIAELDEETGHALAHWLGVLQQLQLATSKVLKRWAVHVATRFGNPPDSTPAGTRSPVSSYLALIRVITAIPTCS